jgi:nucleoside-diphosphate-sugar epimerase
MKTILITGAGGYVGTRMVESFLEKGYSVIALDMFYFGDTLADLNHNKKLRIIKADIRNVDSSLFKDVYAVIDLASISNDPASELLPTITEDINNNGATNVAKTAKEMGVKKFIFASSCSIYGAGNGILTEESKLAPISIYAKCKIAAEENIKKLADENFCVTFLRSSTVFGVSKRRMRFDLIINIMTLHAWKNNKITIMGKGEQWRPLIHVDDLIRAFELILIEENLDKINKQAFNVGSNEMNFRVFEVANQFKKFFPELEVEEIQNNPDQRSYNVNFDKINKTLNYMTCKSIDDGILEIREALEKGIIKDDISTRTVDYYKHLIKTGEILNSN